jgi:formate--tetrahydrofolate ligase
VQTLENNPAFVHGGPFGNIAHGCNSVMATRSALKLADYVVTEAGFGADLGGEKFVDIKCRKAGLAPAAAVMVATVRALKYHGGAPLAALNREDLGALEKGFANLERHVDNVRRHFGLPCVVAINRFSGDTDAELARVAARMAELGVPVAVASHWADGGRGALGLARIVVELAAREPAVSFVYPDDETLWQKIGSIARKIYRAAEVTASAKVREQIDRLQADGYGHFPVCVAKTQYSFSTDPNRLGATEGHAIDVREVRLSAGAEFVVMICGDIMTMPGLPKVPAAQKVDIDAAGRVVGLF